MLSELSCTASQVVINNNGWRCADPVLTRSFAGVMNYNIRRGNGGLYTSVAIGTDGSPVISHHDCCDGDLELYVCGNEACTSGTYRTLVTEEHAGKFTSIAIGVDGNPIISYRKNDGAIDNDQDLVTGSLKLYVCADAACTTGTNRTLVTGYDMAGYFTSIAIGVDGNPIISHGGPDSGLSLYVCDDPTCTTGTNQNLVMATMTLNEGEELLAAGQFTSVAIGADDNPVISHTIYYDNAPPALALYVCDDPTCTTGTNRQLVALEELAAGWGTSVAIGADDNPVISHGLTPDSDGSDFLALYVCDDPTCTAGTNRTLVAEGEAGGYSSIAIGVDGNPIISHYCDECNNLAMYVCDDPTCTTGTNRTIVTADYMDYPDTVGGYTSIAIGVDGNPVISHAANEVNIGPSLNVAIAVFAVTDITFE